MTTNRLDLAYGRRGGRLVAWEGGTPPPAKPCAVCGQPMTVGQRTRHFTCSPPLPCCGYPTDLVADLRQHAADHQQDRP